MRGEQYILSYIRYDVASSRVTPVAVLTSRVTSASPTSAMARPWPRPRAGDGASRARHFLVDVATFAERVAGPRRNFIAIEAEAGDDANAI